MWSVVTDRLTGSTRKRGFLGKMHLRIFDLCFTINRAIFIDDTLVLPVLLSHFS